MKNAQDEKEKEEERDGNLPEYKSGGNYNQNLNESMQRDENEQTMATASVSQSVEADRPRQAAPGCIPD